MNRQHLVVQNRGVGAFIAKKMALHSFFLVLRATMNAKNMPDNPMDCRVFIYYKLRIINRCQLDFGTYVLKGMYCAYRLARLHVIQYVASLIVEIADKVRREMVKDQIC